MVRVIAGLYRGRRLRTPAGRNTRPVTDRAKEAVFSSLGPVVSDAEVADLFAGSGSFGIEALSRGARHVVFVESNRSALDVLRGNLSALGIGPDRATVVADDVERFLASPVRSPLQVVFCDPPWDMSSSHLGGLLETLPALLVAPGVVVVSRRAEDEVPDPRGLRIAHQRRYGDTKIIRYEMGWQE